MKIRKNLVWLLVALISISVVMRAQTNTLRVGYLADEGQLALNPGTTTTTDATANGGTAVMRTSNQPSGGMWYGPYIALPAGNYTVQYRVKVASNASSAAVITLDATNAVGVNYYGGIVVHPSDFRASNDWEIFSLPIKVDANQSNIEFRGVNFTSGITDCYLDYVNVLPGDIRGYSSPQLTVMPNGSINLGNNQVKIGYAGIPWFGGLNAGQPLFVSNGGDGGNNQFFYDLYQNFVGLNFGVVNFGTSSYGGVSPNSFSTLFQINGSGAIYTGQPQNTSISTSSNPNIVVSNVLDDGNGNMVVRGNLKVAGSSITYGDGTTQSTAWTGSLCGGDYAESVDVTGGRANYSSGDVLVIDPDNPGKFLKSAEPYSTSVMGIYSTKPGVLGRRQTGAKSSEEVPMAMIGIVPAKVSAENGPIRPGDLLVTASIPGYAMKGTDRSLMLGAVIGKALGSLDSGTGVIEVGITLQ